MKVQRLLETQEAQGASIKGLAVQIADIDRRLHTLEVRGDVVIKEAASAARAASHEATQGTVADLARRIGALEAQGAAKPPSRRKALKGPEGG